MKRTWLGFVLCLAAVGQSSPQLVSGSPADQDAVRKVDEEYRIAKLKNDTGTLGRILADNFYEMNQNGNERNKEQTIQLFTSFSIRSLTTDSSQVRIAGNTAAVNGTQTEDNDRMLFARIFVKGANGWQLLSSMQYRNPKGPTEEEAVLRVDEANRIAKLKNDTATLSRILADNFYEMNQNGNGRDKEQTIQLWTTFRINSLTTDSSQVRITNDTATVTGTQTEDNDRMLFTRVYVKGANGWQLLSSMQFRNPNPEFITAR